MHLRLLQSILVLGKTFYGPDHYYARDCLTISLFLCIPIFSSNFYSLCPQSCVYIERLQFLIRIVCKYFSIAQKQINKQNNKRRNAKTNIGEYGCKMKWRWKRLKAPRCGQFQTRSTRFDSIRLRLSLTFSLSVWSQPNNHFVQKLFKSFFHRIYFRALTWLTEIFSTTLI